MIVCFLAEGFEETEAIATIDILRRANLEVTIIGVTGQTVTGAHGITVTADQAIEQLTPTTDWKAIVLPGGMPGTLNLENSTKVQETIRFANEHNILIAAICAAPSILGHMYLLEGKIATAFPGFEKDLIGANVINEAVVQDDNIITAKGAGSVFEFGAAIAAEFIGEENAKVILEEMQYC